MTQLVSTLKTLEIGAFQTFIDHMVALVKKATIGYALAMVMNENNLG